MIASSGAIKLTYTGGNNGQIFANGGNGTPGSASGGSGGAIRLVANTISVNQAYGVLYVSGGNGAGSGLARIESNNTNIAAGYVTGPALFSLPFALNLPSAPPPVITVTSINGQPVNANTFSFPDATINTNSPVPVVVKATNLPTGATVNIYLLFENGPNTVVPVTLSGTSVLSTGTVNVTFPPGGTRGFVKATWGTVGTLAPVKN